MSNSTLANVFYIDKSEFLRNMVELAFCPTQVNIFTLSDCDENSICMIKDVGAHLILVDLKTVSRNLKDLINSTNAPIIGVGEKDEIASYENSHNFLSFMEKPLSPIDLNTEVISQL